MPCTRKPNVTSAIARYHCVNRPIRRGRFAAHLHILKIQFFAAALPWESRVPRTTACANDMHSTFVQQSMLTRILGGAAVTRKNISSLIVITLSFALGAQGADATASQEKQHNEVRTVGPQAPTAGAIRLNPNDGLNYVWIPAGAFTMGCSVGDNECFDDEKPAHDVTISKGFWIAQSLVTQQAYKRVTGSDPSRFKGEQLPVEMVNWNDAQNYCRALGMRLPTEAEWEYAARAGSKAARYGDLDVIAWYSGTSGPRPVDGTALYQADPKNYEDNLIAKGNQPHAVARKQANAWQLYDMLGNVWEWASDWFDKNYYRRSEERDPRGPGQWYISRTARWRVG